MKALISVYDKTGVIEAARRLHDAGVGLVSTGGTHKAISDAGVPVQQVSDFTGFPEILDGRVKTLHPHIHSGLLARRDMPEHMDELSRRDIAPIDLLIGNLYPFREAVSKPDATLDDALENIDIGGPTMLRAAAKNFPSVVVLVDPEDYDWAVGKFVTGDLSHDDRRSLAYKAFHHVSVYDSAIAGYLSSSPAPGATETDGGLPQKLDLSFNRLTGLRYGENPHQQGALYVPAAGSAGGIANARQLHGRELSFNNLMDAEAAWRSVTDFEETAAVVIKHTNPCGLASHPDQAEAYNRAYAGDPVSAFGGILGFNRTVTVETAQAASGIFYEVIVAPGYEPEALEILKKRRNLRVLEASPEEGGLPYDLRPLSGGLLVQSQDASDDDPAQWNTVTKRAPTQREAYDLSFAWKAAKHVKSNAIVLARDNQLLGMGAGQPNRVTSVHLALRAAGERAVDCVLASDAFFPFPDNIELAAKGGVTAIVQPGGSIRDDEVIAEADKAGIAMMFTGVRHFRH